MFGVWNFRILGLQFCGLGILDWYCILGFVVLCLRFGILEIRILSLWFWVWDMEFGVWDIEFWSLRI